MVSDAPCSRSGLISVAVHQVIHKRYDFVRPQKNITHMPLYTLHFQSTSIRKYTHSTANLQSNVYNIKTNHNVRHKIWRNRETEIKNACSTTTTRATTTTYAAASQRRRGSTQTDLAFDTFPLKCCYQTWRSQKRTLWLCARCRLAGSAEEQNQTQAVGIPVVDAGGYNWLAIGVWVVRSMDNALHVVRLAGWFWGGAFDKAR